MKRRVVCAPVHCVLLSRSCPSSCPSPEVEFPHAGVCGDVDGKGAGRSIYGEPFPHDNYSIMHNTAGIVSMVNSGVGGSSGTSDSRFLIQPIDDAGFLDGRYEAFGRVVAGLEVVRKIEAVRKMIDKTGRDIRLEVDGGVDARTAPMCVDAGADVLVAGTATFKGGSSCYADNIAVLKGLVPHG